MPAPRQINLLKKDDFEESPLGRFLKWSINTGRWIVVFTDLVVICAFLSRFYFDTKLANLHDDIKQGQTIIEATSDFEETFRSLQSKLSLAKTILGAKFEGESQVSFIDSILPSDVVLENFSITKEEISLSGKAFSEAGMASLLKNLLSSPQITKINISSLLVGEKEGTRTITFGLTAGWKNLL